MADKDRFPMWRCDGFASVRAATEDDAAAIFTRRLAVREFGKFGYVKECTMQRKDFLGQSLEVTYSARIGRDVASGGPFGGRIARLVVRTSWRGL